MEIGNEISQKIRSAIKAKLVELGAYVDEELPDYIMVMVANKKNQTQMSEDLSLFLGTNTEKFTSWLHGLLAKLQSLTTVSTVDKPTLPKLETQKSDTTTSPITTTIAAVAESHVKDNENVEMPKGRKHSSGTSDDKLESKKDSTSRKRKAVDECKSREKAKPEDPHKTDLAAVPEKIHENVAVPSRKLGPEKDESASQLASAEAGKRGMTTQVKAGETIQIGVDEDISELILTETDELAEELEREGINLPNKKEHAKEISSSATENGALIKSKVPTVTVAPTSGSSRESTPLSPSSSHTRPKAVTSPIRRTAPRQIATKVVAPHISELFTRKKRPPVSVVGSVSHDTEEDDEAYDPYNPAVGSVASIVKVTARKSSVPVNLQANKSLLLKAISEAEKSVESVRRVAITPVKPIIRSEVKEREEERHVKRQPNLVSKVSKPSQPTPRLAQTSLRQAIDQPKPSHQSEYPVYIPTRKVHPSQKLDISERVGLISKSRREEAAKQALVTNEKNSGRTSALVAGKKKMSTSLIITRKHEVEPAQNRKKASQPPDNSSKQAKAEESVIDSRVVEYEPAEAVSLQDEEKSVVSACSMEAASQGIPEILEDVEDDEFILDQEDMDLAENESSTLFEEDMRDVNVKDKQRDKTRFVVTLDGVDNEQYEEMTEAQTEPVKRAVLEVDDEMVPVSQIKEAASTHISPPKIQPFSINLKDSDEEGEGMQEEDATPLKKAKMTERCKFWPACVNGAACEYHHPTVHCKTFPQCRFGDKCLYIHPNCRFDSKCVRPDCPFTHSSRRSFVKQIIPRPSIPIMIPVPAPRSSNPPQCKFFPSCSNMNCPFFHPKPCRFGLSCKNRELSCPYFHPPLPAKDKLRWSAEKEKSASRMFSKSDL